MILFLLFVVVSARCEEKSGAYCKVDIPTAVQDRTIIPGDCNITDCSDGDNLYRCIPCDENKSYACTNNIEVNLCNAFDDNTHHVCACPNLPFGEGTYDNTCKHTPEYWNLVIAGSVALVVVACLLRIPTSY